MVVEGLDSSGRRWRSRVAMPIIWLFVQPLRPIGRLVDQLGELRFDPTG
jgi:hypothetical protein